MSIVLVLEACQVFFRGVVRSCTHVCSCFSIVSRHASHTPLGEAWLLMGMGIQLVVHEACSFFICFLVLLYTRDPWVGTDPCDLFTDPLGKRG